jgi:ribosomal protein L3 glutamine methyltransferase
LTTTIARLVESLAVRFNAAGLYFGHGTDNAEDEAWYLALGVLGLPFGVDCSERPVTPEERTRVEQVAERRIRERVPTAYLLGEAWFAGLPFHIDAAGLVPRSPIAELIAAGFSPWVNPDAVRRVVDVGTGCGCIAIATALALPEAEVIGIDLSPAALRLAARNRERHGVGDRLALLQGDLMSAIAPGAACELIVANLPYVPVEELATLPAEYLHEPRLALAGGADGLDLVDRLLGQAADCLAPAGVLVCEVGDGLDRFEARYPGLAVTWLDFEYGGDGVFVVDAGVLRAWRR